MDLTVDLRGKVALVTGAGGNIGGACALALARCGAVLALNDVREDALAAVCDRVRAMGRRALPLPGDSADHAVVRELGHRALAELGPVFVYMNVAGEAMPKHIVDMSEAEWDRTQAANVKSLFNWCQVLLPSMLAGEGGRIVGLSSVSGKQGGDLNSVSRAAYAAAKGGVMGFVRGLAREVAPKVTVNAICPGLVLNDRTRRLLAARPQMMEQYLMGRPGTGEDVAKALLYFVAADWVTGEVTDVNGGYYID
jgi:3-oxoacyl-[acyl-carrier protein] reductase